MKIVVGERVARAVDGKADIGLARWHETAPGVVQLIELVVEEKRRRAGVGGELLRAVVKAARPRKMWVALGHRSSIVARAFLTRHGFHHVSTTRDLLSGEDLLVYVKSWV